MIGFRRLLATILMIPAVMLGMMALTIMPNSDAAALKEKFNAVRR